MFNHALAVICAAFMGGRSAPPPASALLLEQLPKVSDLTLPASVQKYLRRNAHPALQRDLKTLNLSLTGYDPQMGFHRAAIGEGMQSLFVAQVLNTIQPSVHLYKESDMPASTRFLMLHDPWQGSNPPYVAGNGFPAGTWEELVSYHSLAMPLLKAANALYSAFPSRKALRAQLGLSPQLKIVSLYVFRADFSSPSFKKLLSQIEDVYSYDVLIISDARDLNFTGIDRAVDEGAEVRLLSQTTLGDLRQGGKRILLNNTIGNLPQLNAFANLAIIRGPIDFLGPLQSGTPVIGVNDDESLRNFHRQGYARMRQLAEATGAAVFVSDLSKLNSSAVENIVGRDFKRPFEIPISGDRTALDLLLRALELHLI